MNGLWDGLEGEREDRRASRHWVRHSRTLMRDRLPIIAMFIMIGPRDTPEVLEPLVRPLTGLEGGANGRLACLRSQTAVGPFCVCYDAILTTPPISLSVVPARRPQGFTKLLAMIHQPHHVYLINVDAKASPALREAARAQAAALGPNVHLLDPPGEAVWGAFSMVLLELRGMAALLSRGEWCSALRNRAPPHAPAPLLCPLRFALRQPHKVGRTRRTSSIAPDFVSRRLQAHACAHQHVLMHRPHNRPLQVGLLG